MHVLLLLFSHLLEEAIDDGDSKHDTSAATDGSHEVGEDAKSAQADTTESGSNVDVTRQILNHRLLAEVVNSHVLVHQVLDDVTRGGSGHIDPDAREESARAHHEGAVEDEVEGVTDNAHPLARWRDVVG